MDCFEQLNKLFPNEQHNTIIKSQICTLDCRNSTAVKEETKLPSLLKEAGNKLSSLSAPETKQLYNSQGKNLPKMSDWGDDDTEAIDGKCFGNVFYKPHENEDGNGDYNDDANGNDNGYENNRRYQGGGGGRGRNGDRGRSGGGFNRYNNDNANDENGESNAQENTISQEEENYQNFVFALTPKDFSKESLKDFLKNMKNLFHKASLVQKYTLMRYLMEAYENILENTQQTESNKKNTRTKKKPEQQLQTSLGDAVPIVRTIEVPADYETRQEMFPDLPISFGVASMSSPSGNSEVVDVLNIYQAESELNNPDDAPTDNNVTQLESVLPFYQAPTMNISNLFESMEPEQDLHVSPIRPNQASSLHQEQTPDIITRRHSERLQAKEFQMSACVRQTSHSSTPRRSRYSLRPLQSGAPLPYLGETPPLTPTRPKPRTYISEEEYSLRFRLPRKKFLEITELPHVKCGIEASSLLDVPMDTSLIDEEYLYDSPGDHVPTDNILTHPASITAMTTIVDQYSSLNAVRQAPSSMQELSSFGRPLQATQMQDLSRLDNERRLNTNAVNQDIQSHTENVNAADNVANISTDSIPAMGMMGESLQQLQSQEQQDPNQIHNDQPTVMEAINMPQLPTEFTADSGIQFPAATLTADSGGHKHPPLHSIIDSASAGQQAKPPPQTEITPSDSGLFKTPMIPPELPIKTAAITSLPSIEVHDFESNLISRNTLNTSTPLGVTRTEDALLQLLKHRKTLLTQKERGISNLTEDVSGVSAMMEDNQQTNVAVQTTQSDQLTLPPIVEVGEEVIRPSESLTVAGTNGDNAPQQTAATETQNEDYRRDWYEILRTRLQNSNNYVNCTTTPKRKRKFKRPQRTKPELQAVNLNETVNEPPAISNLLQQTLAGILPSLTAPANVSLTANLNNSTDRLMPCQIGDNFPSPVISPQQQQYDEFIFNNVENISKIVDNLDSCRLMLENYRRGIERKLNSAGSDGFKQLCEHFNPDVLLNAPEERLAIKLNLVQNIIRQVSFDFTKCECIKNRMSAAIGFAFLLELKSAGIISLSSDGRNVALRYNSERRNGFGGGRGRGGGGRGGGGRGGGGGFRDGGRRDNRGGAGGGDYNQQNNSGGYGGGGNNDNGEEQKKPREFYIPPEPTDNEDEIFGSGITSGINFSKYDKIPVKVTGENAPPSITTFEEANFRDIVLNNIKKSGYKIPTPIQKSAIPVILSGRDLMACAQTGSGKTAAFLLPIINSLLSEGAEVSIGRPQALIVSPTRELAIQIFNEARKFSMGSYLNIRIVYGGTSSKHQGENIGRGGSHILICTPGRLLDFVEKGLISFEECRFMVLDEADRMLDMGFKDNVATIMNHCTMRPIEERQNLMFSATFPAEIQRMAGEYLNEYIFISIGVVGGACADVTQNIYEVKKFQKRAKLMEILQENAEGTIVFVETKRGADFLASLLSETDIPTTSIHGDRLQRQREMALADFKSGKMKVLIATSVAARGLDIKNVNHVVNYDMPSSIDEYVHRIGRTGRVGNNGRATSFFDPESDSAIATDLVNILEGAGQLVPDFLKNYSSGGGGGGGYGNQFGGRDVRKGLPQTDDNFITSSGPAAFEEEEDWN